MLHVNFTSHKKKKKLTEKEIRDTDGGEGELGENGQELQTSIHKKGTKNKT